MTSPRLLSDLAPAVDTSQDGPVRPVRPVRPVTFEGYAVTGRDDVPNEIRAWLATYICPLSDLDLDLLTLWALHTHFVESVFYSTPRLLIDSPLPASGKTTTLEHLERLSFDPLQMASVSSPAMLARLLDTGLKTLLIDECEKTLRPDKPGVEELLGVLNSGYKRGGSRPVLVQSKGGEWVTKVMPTFAPVAMAGISPHLPDDTLSRCVTVMLLPDAEGVVEDSDWEFIDELAIVLAERVAGWVEEVAEDVKANNRPEIPDSCKGRFKEKWRPLKRVADAAGGRWPEVCTELIVRDIDNRQHDKEQGLMTQRPAVAIVRDILTIWPEGVSHWATDDIAGSLIDQYPDRWGPTERYPKGLSAQRIGRYLGKQWGVHATRATDGSRIRGYLKSDLHRLGVRAGLVHTPQIKPDEPDGLAEPDGLKTCVVCKINPPTPPNATCKSCRDRPHVDMSTPLPGLSP